MKFRRLLIAAALAPILTFTIVGAGLALFTGGLASKALGSDCPIVLKPLCAYELGAMVSLKLRVDHGLDRTPLAVLLPYEYLGGYSFHLRNPDYSPWAPPN